MTDYGAIHDLLLEQRFRYVVSVMLGGPADNHVIEKWTGPLGNIDLDVERGEIGSVLCRVPTDFCRSPRGCRFAVGREPAAPHRGSARARVDVPRALEMSLRGCATWQARKARAAR